MKRLVFADKEYEAGGKTFDGYMGAIGWEGQNAHENLDIKDIAKIVRSQFRKKFPGYKISVRISRFSGGEAIDAQIWIPKTDLMSKDQFMKDAEYNPYQFIRGYRRMGYKAADGRWIEHSYDDFYDMPKEEVVDFFSNWYDYTLEHYTSTGSYPTINYPGEAIPLVNDEALKYVKDLIDSFNWDDSNSMVDYFSTNFYSHIEYAYL